MSQEQNVNQSIQVANTIGQVGCVIGFIAIFIIGIAFGAGTLIDQWMGNERQWVTIILMRPKLDFVHFLRVEDLLVQG